MTKTEYAEYLASDYWKELRRGWLEIASSCERCSMPRYLANICYDQDLHLHHKNYRNLGREECDDLEVLCRRCHEIETFGRSQLKEYRSINCSFCDKPHWDLYHLESLCPGCADLFGGPSLMTTHLLRETPFLRRRLLWQYLLWSIAYNATYSATEVSIDDIVNELVLIVEAQLQSQEAKHSPKGVSFSK